MVPKENIRDSKLWRLVVWAVKDIQKHNGGMVTDTH
jgi:hypothetical protein